ncbi:MULTISPECIES: nickel-responsive transcriptional regulator NikR [Rhizobium]|uniref:Putative nickel-responsive regulator n=1 Tax=Rhizobium tropici TaxID=398 RepID=A0A329Y800_RHITR|nr:MULTISPECIES: nickel-responsive transcriptional regulator NikR [Rhizobium]MBB3285181.1 CopG family nickel-responsive transcriptional regulator [Rhizobium sp. BK252]MBB3399920.1 CopG family nickel-responsive transcriptional regulator [Rhizobium sp. BK289]MBB3412500.1 CopG family nickel-responsive transcriptional regulator [Rhizobium sp. BK284]MBB3480386.1 CopG family nickel-responsive transcriptional regulator [Rhizobium sp. BK347]MDK4719059.1 nickel-responsive transcriptional regulator NikR
MQRITITIDDDLLETIDKISAQRGYASRSETLRDLVRDAVTRAQPTVDGEARCYATLTYVYEHETRDLSRRLTTAQHHHHDLSVSTLHVHIDGHDCLEVSVLKGKAEEVMTFADSVITQRGVRFGNLHIIPTDHAGEHSETHSHD